MESALRRGAGQPGLKLIETMAWDGQAIARQDLHLARLQAGARALGWAFDSAAAAAALRPMGPPARLRLTLDAQGRIEVATAALPLPAARWTAALSGVRLDSADPWLRIKSTRRDLYDRARADLPEGVDEWLFANERGEVCEGTITNVFFDRGQGLRTPPMTCGLLPGVLRAHLLAKGQAREEVLPLSDLAHVRLWLGNSLRGLIPVTLRP